MTMTSDTSARYPRGAIPSKRVAVFYAAYFGVLGAVLPFLGPFLSWKGLGAVGVGLVTAAFSLAKLVYTPLVGAAVDRGRWVRGVLTGHCLLAAGCALAAAGLAGPWQLGLAFFALGVGYGTVLPLVEAAVLERLPAVGYGPLRLWGSLGFVAISMVTAAALGRVGLGWFPTLVTALLVLLAGACLWLESAARPEPHSERSGRLGGVAWALLVLLTVHQVTHGPYYAFFSIELDAAGFSPAWIAGLWSLGVVAEAATFLAGSRIEARLGRVRLLGIALALTPLRWALLALPPTLAVLVVAQLGHALTFAAAHLAGIQLVQRLVPANAARRAQSLYSGLTFGLGIVAGTALAGPVYGALGAGGAFLGAAGLSVVVLLGWVVLLRAAPVLRTARS